MTSILGADYENGTGTFKAKGTSESRVDLSLGSGTRSDVRNVTNGTPAGAWAKNGGNSTAYADHNCWTDAAWFFPALSSLTQTTNPNFIFSYVGQEQHGGLNAQHIRVYQLGPFQAVSTLDFYPLDPGFRIFRYLWHSTRTRTTIWARTFQAKFGLPIIKP